MQKLTDGGSQSGLWNPSLVLKEQLEKYEGETEAKKSQQQGGGSYTSGSSTSFYLTPGCFRRMSIHLTFVQDNHWS